MIATQQATTRLLTFREHQQRTLGRDELPESVALTLVRDFSDQIEVEFPSPRTDGRWRLTAQGWVGHVPVGRDHALRIEPKVPIGSLFRMLEYAYELEAFRASDAMITGGSIDDFFSRLARLLAQRVSRRARRGLYRSYLSRTERLSFIRGRIDLEHALRRPYQTRRRCTFEENTADVEDNQILLWTLRRILHTGGLSPEAREQVQHSQRILAGAVSVQPFRGADCRERLYNRLNTDYESLHALCAFFLDHTGPVRQTGAKRSVPFLINMWKLFEDFVAEWLRQNLPAGLRLSTQVSRHYDPERRVKFVMDMLITDAETGRPLMVLDTKYKDVASPKPEDVAQVVSYAVRMGAPHAMLIYAGRGPGPLNFQVGPVDVTSDSMSLEQPRAAAEQISRAITAQVGSPATEPEASTLARPYQAAPK